MLLKSGPQTHIIPLLLFISGLGWLTCEKRENVVDDFSTGLANRDEKISEGVFYIENRDIKKGREFFEKLGRQNNKHCGYLIGLSLVHIQDYLDRLSSFLNLIISVPRASKLHERSSLKLKHEQCDDSIDRIVRGFVSEIRKASSESIELIQRAIDQKCEMDLDYPIMISVGPSFIVSIATYGRIGDVELSLLKYLGNIVMILADIVLIHDLSINTLEVLSNVKKIDSSSAISLLRTLAFLLHGCSLTFSFHPEGKKLLEEIPKKITDVTKNTLELLSFLEDRESKEAYAITFKDGSGEKKLGYDPNTTTIDTPQDQISIKIRGVAHVGRSKANIKEINVKVPYIITHSFLADLQSLIRKIEDIVGNRKRGCPENCLSVSDFNFFFKSFGIYLEDFIRFDIIEFIENAKPLREALPYWFYNQNTSRWEFVIEAEVPESRTDLRPYIFNYDSGHFFYPPILTFYGEVISNHAIPPDCVFVKDVPLNWVFIPYVLFQDPTFSKSFYMRLKWVFLERCNRIELEYDGDEWKPPNVYMMNKAIALIVQRSGSILSPLADLILRSIEIVQ